MPCMYNQLSALYNLSYCSCFRGSDNDMITSFSNPNYGLDAVNSNSVTSPMMLCKAPGIDCNQDMVDNGGHRGNGRDPEVDNIRHYTSEYDQVCLG